MRLSFCVFALLLLAGVGKAQGSRVAAPAPTGGVLFRIPNGWLRGVKDGITFARPTDLAPGQKCLLTILPEQEVRGDLTAWFNETRKTLQGDELRLARQDNVVFLRADSGEETVFAGAVGQAADGQPAPHYFYLALRSGARATMLRFATNSKQAFQQYQPAFAAFVGGLTFLKAGAAESPRPAATPTPAPVPAAPDEGHGFLRFRAPEGWKRRRQKGLLIFDAPNTPEKKCWIMLTPILDLDRITFREGFDSVRKAARGKLKTVTDTGAQPSRRDRDGVDLLTAEETLGDAAAGKKTFRLYVGGKVGSRFQIIVFEAPDQALYDRYAPAFLAFIADLRFAREPAGIAPGP